MRSESSFSASAKALSAGLPILLVRARHVAFAVLAGGHGRRRAGNGDGFWQFRQYQPNESAGLIDWRRSASGSELLVREREWESPQTVWLFRDRSASMDWPNDSAGVERKSDRADLLLLALAVLMGRADERVGLLDTPDQPGRGAAALTRLALGLQEGLGQGRLAPLSYPRTVHLHRIKPHSHLVWISDFLDPPADLRHALSFLARRSVSVTLMQLLAEPEEQFSFFGRIRFLDVESSRAIQVQDAAQLQINYQTRLAALRNNLARIADLFGFSCLYHRCHDPAALGLAQLYRALARSR